MTSGFHIMYTKVFLSLRLEKYPVGLSFKGVWDSKKVGSKLNIQKTKIMASNPITSRQIDGETKETMTDFIFLGSKITADGDCSHEIKRRLLLRRKAMTNLKVKSVSHSVVYDSL